VLYPLDNMRRKIIGMIGDGQAKCSSADRQFKGVVMTGRIVRIILGIVLALLGIVWILQGADVFGGSGGMNGKSIWIVIGAVVLIGGLAVLAPLRHRQQE